jgi:glycosyltransferase involved in cell wall biosynthesis
MNILFVSEFFYPRLAGGELISWQLLNGLAKKGHNIYVITSRMPKTMEIENINGIEIYRPISSAIPVQKGSSIIPTIIKRVAFMVRMYSYLKKHLKHHSVDIVYNMGYFTALPVSLVASRYHYPAVCSIRSFCGKSWFQFTNYFLAILNYLGEKNIIRLGKYDMLHCPSNKVAEDVKTCIPANIFVIPNPIDFDEIKKVRENTDSKLIRNLIGIEENEQFLLFVGSLVKVKNIDGLIKVLGKLKMNYKLVIVGEGPERIKIGGLITRLGLGYKVILLGEKPHKETLRIIRSCDIFVLPSKSETFSNVSLEALLLGKPVISTRVGVLPEIESENLYLIDNLEEINSLLEKGIKGKDDKRFLKMCLATYSMDNVVARFDRMFQNEIKSKS